MRIKEIEAKIARLEASPRFSALTLLLASAPVTVFSPFASDRRVLISQTPLQQVVARRDLFETV